MPDKRAFLEPSCGLKQCVLHIILLSLTPSQTIPDVFQKHKTYPMPEEDKQIRRGGNGQIFATEYFGYSLVAKKTLFRNREYNIILRLNHSNIVPLLALMVGEVSHRRRFFCYHMLPRMSGE